MTLMEIIGQVPSQYRLIIFKALGKLSGGTRLIASLSGIYRLWSRARVPLIREWAARHERKYLYAGVGMGSVDAVQDAMAEDEVARTDGSFSCSVLDDVSKCYEEVEHAVAVESALALDFPLRVLKVIMDMYSAPRRILFNGAYSAAVATARAIVPGCSFATWLLRALMIRVVDPAIEQLTEDGLSFGVHYWLRLYADDVNTQGVGHSETSCVDRAVKVRSKIREAITRGAGLRYADKMQVVASSSRVRAGVIGKIRNTKMRDQADVNFLGLDFASGRAIGTGVRRGTFIEDTFGKHFQMQAWLDSADFVASVD